MENREEKPRVRIYSYSKVWNIEKKVYSFQNLTLPVPVNPYELLEVLGMVLVMSLLSKWIPLIAGIPAVLKYVALPYVVVKFLMKQKLDGKNPFRYLLGIVPYMLSKGCYMEHFRTYTGGRKKVRLRWRCSKGI